MCGYLPWSNAVSFAVLRVRARVCAWLGRLPVGETCSTQASVAGQVYTLRPSLTPPDQLAATHFSGLVLENTGSEAVVVSLRDASIGTDKTLQATYANKVSIHVCDVSGQGNGGGVVNCAQPTVTHFLGSTDDVIINGFTITVRHFSAPLFAPFGHFSILLLGVVSDHRCVLR